MDWNKGDPRPKRLDKGDAKSGPAADAGSDVSPFRPGTKTLLPGWKWPKGGGEPVRVA